MQPIAFCSRCRGMRVGWNNRYIVHCLVCRHWAYRSVRISFLAAAVIVIIFAFPLPTGIALPDAADNQDQQPAVMQASLVPVITRSVPAPPSAAVTAIDSMLAKYNIETERR